jgi:uncharacterized membrane protein
LIVVVPAGVPTGSSTIKIMGTSGTLSASTTFTLNVTPQPTFTLSAAASTVTLPAGHTATDALEITPVNGFTGTASFSAGGLPAGVTAAFAPSSSTTGTTLTLTAAPSATPGTYTVTISAAVAGTGSSNPFTETTTISLVISASATPGFSLGLNPAKLSLTHGGSTGATVAITLTPTNGFNGSVSYSLSGAPTNLDDAFLTNGSNETLVLYAPASTAPGSYTITVVGKSGSATATAPLALTVQ